MARSQEQQIWDDVQLFWAEEAEEPPLPDLTGSTWGSGGSREEMDPPAVVVAGAFSVILLLLFGEARAALGVAVATAIGWTLWHYKERLAGWWAQTGSPTVVADGGRDA